MRFRPIANFKRKIARNIVSIQRKLILNLDAADYSAVPVDGSTIAGTDSYIITVKNSNSKISWNSADGGVFRVTSAATNSTDFFAFGPNYSSGTQAFTIGMAYKWNGTTAGRLLNANSASPDFLMGLWGSGTCRMNIAYGGTFIGSSSTLADEFWNFIWITSTGIAGASKAKAYVAGETASSPLNGTDSTMGGFNGLRLFGRFASATTISEPVDADVAFVKVWDGVLSLEEIQAEHELYKARFGY